MKKFITKNSLMILALLMSTITFAQNPGDFDEPTDTNPLDVPPTPIGDYIWVLALVALVYVFYKMRSKVQSAN
jgi:hypothetical protein